MQPGRYYVVFLHEPRTSYGKAHPIVLNVGDTQRLGMSVEEAKDVIKQLTKAVEMAEERR
jgi:hypothetical protein